MISINSITIIHLHPSLSYLGRAYSLCDPHRSIFLLNGPSILHKENLDFAKYLQSRLEFFRFARLRPRILLRISFLQYLIKCLSESFQSPNRCYINDAVIDSILRNRRLSRLYYFAPCASTLIYLFYFFYFYCLLAYYMSYIHSCRPSHVIVSHCNYSQYAALIVAALSADIKVTSIIGAFDKAFTFQLPAKSYHYCNYLRDIACRWLNLVDSPSFPLNKTLIPDASTSIFSDTSLKIIRPSKTTPPDTLLIVMHCFADNCHISDTDAMLFSNYYTWLEKTCNIIAQMPYAYNAIIIKVHPHIETFGDLDLLHALIRSSGIKEFSNVSICNPDQKLSEISDCIVPIILTVHGSITYEAGSLGVPVVSCGLAHGPTSAQYRPSSINEYTKLLHSPEYAARCLDVLPPSNIISKDSLAYFQLLQALKPRNEIKALNILSQYFYFGTKRRELDANAIDILSRFHMCETPPALMHSNSDWRVYHYL